MREFASSLLVTVANETLYQLSYDPDQLYHNQLRRKYSQSNYFLLTCKLVICISTIIS